MAHGKGSRLVAALAVAALAACGTAGAAKEEESPPARVERVKGTRQRRVILSPSAARRIGLKVVPISGATGGGAVVPYASLLYDPSGRTWVYTRVKPRTFQRARVTVDRIEGDQVYLSASPPVGTRAVSVGTAELYGTEFFSGHE